jgi:hypothetical protein
MQLIKSATICSLTAMALAACGGSGNDTGSATEQSKRLTRQTKSAAATYQTAVESLYVAYFGRPADPNGLANFAAALQAAGAPTSVAGLAQAYSSNAAIKSLIDSFGTSTESQNLYGGGTTTAFVTAVFENVLGRAPQSAGLSFWVGAIDSGSVSQGDAALSIMAGALANTTAQGLIDAQLVNNRLAAAGYFTGAASAATYTGAAAAANARAMLATINSATTASALQSTAVTDAQSINNQTVFESLALHGGEWYIYDNIPYGGGALTPGQNYVYAEVVNALTASPSTGAQQATTYFSTLDTALSVPGAGATRVLQNGQVFLHPVQGLRSVTYNGSGIRVQYFDSSGSTIIATSQFDNYQAVSLSGQMSASSEELQSAVPINQWIAYANFATTATWQSGAGYIKHQGHAVGDQYSLDDCASANPTSTTGTSPTPCATGVSLASIFPITLYAGDADHPGETYFATDGTFATEQGLSMWIANTPLPPAENGVALYRIFVLLNGNVVMGSLIKDGSPYYYEQADGSTVNYILALNQAAASSVSKGLITGTAAGGSKSGFGTTVSNTPDLFGIGGTGIDGSLSPADLRTHYNVPSGLTGAGQTIAIVDGPSSYDIEADLAAYSTYYNLPACTSTNGCYKHVDFSNGAAVSSDNDWGGEPDLDVQMVHAVAPGANVVLITAASGSGTDLFAAVQYAYTLPGVTAVSMSFGASGFDSQTDNAFMMAAQNGGAIPFASSGDAGYLGNSPNFPSSSLWAIGVGGTRINNVKWTSSASEAGWQFSGGGTASGISPASWMTPVQPQAQLAGSRGVPDVGAVADFQNSAVSTYAADQWGLSGGTSASAPLWAGFAALLGESVGAKNQSLLQKLGSPQGGFGKIVYQMAASSNASTLFYRPASGSNNLTSNACALCTATGTYNEVTGVGAPNVANMVTYLGGSVTALDSNPKLGTPAYKMMRRSLKVKALPPHLLPARPQGN